MSHWKLASSTPPIILDVNASDNGPMTGTLTSAGTSYTVSGGWAASGSVPGRNASAFALAGSSAGAATAFVAASGIMKGPGQQPVSITIQLAESRSADGSTTTHSATLLPQ